VVVNEAFVHRYLAGKDPVGQRFCIDPTEKTYWYEIVGVVGDMHRQGLERASIPEYFGPYVATPSGRVDLVVRTRGNPLAATAAVKDAVAAVVPGAVIPQVGTLDAALGDFSAQRRLQTLLLASFALLALVLAAVGIYGMVHYAVARRTREIGVRIAIGARPLDLFGRVMLDGLRWPLAGVAIGLVIAAAAARLMAHLLFGVTTSDPITFTAVAVAFVVTACAACLPPARRATRVDAVAALRVE
jgi:ABC-type antimicrobial peptide transport system permease subunit